MRSQIAILALLTALAVHAGDHRVCTYRGYVYGTAGIGSADGPTRINRHAWLVVDWSQDATSLDNGWQALAKITIVASDGDGGVSLTEYSQGKDASDAPFTVVPRKGSDTSLLAVNRSKDGWEGLTLEGSAYDLTIDGAAWSVPLRLRGRYLSYTKDAGPVAASARYTFLFDRSMTLATATVTDAQTAFDTAIANAEAAARSGR